MTPRTARPLAGVITALVLALAAPAWQPTVARAATAQATVTNLVVAPASGSPWRKVTTSFDWCVPDGTQPGDSFVVGLPDVLGGWPTTFPLSSTAGVAVATGTVNAGPPSFLTITLNDAMAGQSNVCGTVSMQSQARNGNAVAGTQKTVYYNTPSGVLSAPLAFDPITPGTQPVVARKDGWFTTEDQCRTNGTRCLNYVINTPLGPDTADWTVVDTPPAGQSIDCATVSGYWQDASGAWVRGFNADRWTVNSCTPTSLSYTIHGLLDGLQGVVRFSATTSPTPAGGVTYDNTATITRAGETPRTLTARLTSNKAIGTAVGTAIQVDKRDADGNAGDTEATRVALPDGTARIVVTYTNRGLDPLHTVVVRDNTLSGTGLVQDLSCDFSRAAAGAPTSGVVWDGPWPVGTSFTCTGTLRGVTPEGHYDLATVTAYDPSGAVVRGKDGYHATRPVVSIGDHAWWDADRDGIQDVGEAPAPGVVVELYDADGNRVGVDTTDAKGFYSFLGLPTASRYRLRFTAPGGASWTTTAAGGDKATDSDVDASGQVWTTTPPSGRNQHDTPDDPTIDAGLVRHNLRLAKALATRGPFAPGQVVTYTLTPSNDGPSAALPGWSVTDVPPAGLQVTGMSGRGYTCTVATRTCTSTLPLAAGKGNPVTVTARLVATSGTVHNTAYVRPAAGDVTETVPLGTVPGAATDTSRTATDNDAQASLAVAPTTWTYLVQADRYHVVVPGNPAATRANAKLVASLDDDGALFWREDKGTNCQRTKSPTCLWYRTDNAVVTVKVQSVGQPSTAQVLAAYNAVAPARIGKVSTTARMASVTGDTTVAWILGPGATAAQPWGARHTTWQAYLGHS